MSVSFQMLPQWRLTLLNSRHYWAIERHIIPEGRVMQSAVSVSHSVQGSVRSVVTVITHSEMEGSIDGTLNVMYLVWDGKTKGPRTIGNAIAGSLLRPTYYDDDVSKLGMNEMSWQQTIARALEKSNALVIREEAVTQKAPTSMYGVIQYLKAHSPGTVQDNETRVVGRGFCYRTASGKYHASIQWGDENYCEHRHSDILTPLDSRDCEILLVDNEAGERVKLSEWDTVAGYITPSQVLKLLNDCDNDAVVVGTYSDDDEQTA